MSSTMGGGDFLEPERISGMLTAAEETLRTRVLAGAEDERRFAGLMVASAMAMAARAVDAADALADARRGVSALAPAPSPFAEPLLAVTTLIRAGMFDGDPEAYRRLVADAEARTRVTRPGVVSPGK
ncbi:MAG: hypothetical protein ACRC7G_11855 [Beijerinckiaceae bacterium]